MSLSILAAIFGVGVEVRNALYDRQMLRILGADGVREAELRLRSGRPRHGHQQKADEQ